MSHQQQQYYSNHNQTVTEPDPYFLNRVQSSMLDTKNGKLSNNNETFINPRITQLDLNTNPIINSVILRNSTDREMTPDSIDDDTENGNFNYFKYLS